MDEFIARKKLEKEGFTAFRVTSTRPFSYFGKHKHDFRTAQFILNGELTIEKNGSKKTLRDGDRVDFPKGATHVTYTGPDGCEFVSGFK